MVIAWAPSGMEGGLTSCNTVSAVFQASDRGRSLVFGMVNYPPRLHVADGKRPARFPAGKRSAPLPCREEGWGRSSLKCRLACGHQEVQQRPPLPAARCYHRQQALGKATPRLAVCPETALPPQ